MKDPYRHPSLASAAYEAMLAEGDGQIPVCVPIIDAAGDPAILTTGYRLTKFPNPEDFEQMSPRAMLRTLIHMTANSYREADKLGARPQDPR